MRHDEERNPLLWLVDRLMDAIDSILNARVWLTCKVFGHKLVASGEGRGYCIRCGRVVRR